MGFYINPTDCSKEEWLEANGKRVVEANPDYDKPEGKHFVCWVDNGLFTAAGIAFAASFAIGFQHETDVRPHLWWIVPDSKLIEVCPEVRKVLK